MGVQFLPDRAQKRSRLRKSVMRAAGCRNIMFDYSNIKPRKPTRVHLDYDTGKVLPPNKQNKIRFFGWLHQVFDHGPTKSAQRQRQAKIRWEAGYGSVHRRVASRLFDRRRSYL